MKTIILILQQTDTEALRQVMQEELSMYKWIAAGLFTGLGGLCISLAAFLWNSEKRQTAQILHKLENNDERFRKQLELQEKQQQSQEVVIRLLAKEMGMDISLIMPAL